MPHKDPEKRREYRRNYMRSWYQKNSTLQVQRNRKRRQAIREWFSEFKASLKCSRCNENHPACLEFHHADPSQKETTINSAIWQLDWGKERILAEAAKCIILCANCHRKLHWDEEFRG
jgi:transcription elongation factor Elf1